MKARLLLLLVLLLPGLALPSGIALSLCLCGPTRDDAVDTCAGKACCAPRTVQNCAPRTVPKDGEAAWKSAEICEGCKSFEAPRSQAPEVLPTAPIAWFDPTPCIVQDPRAAEPSNDGVRCIARPTATGPPPDRASIPLRI